VVDNVQNIPRQVFIYLKDWDTFTDGRPPRAKRVPLPLGRPKKIWTLFRHEAESDSPSLPFRPVHRVNAFLEDYVHDWNDVFVEPGKVELDYFSRVVDRPVWLLLEYA
jgi:hypothetical protein